MLNIQDQPPTNQLLFIGVGRYVIALDSLTGRQICATLKGTGISNPTLIIPDSQEAFTGIEVWENKLTSIGMGFPTMAHGGDPVRFNQNTSNLSSKDFRYSTYKFDPEDYVYVASNFIVRAISIRSG
ncbi:UNVERIFIED_CONTAM: hypothetical protein HDU68_005971 [Siphonaria sp. JEL0065]|nr:hypothetical protein HDU68_005971 [Siphonaria sp. JEL0065]